MPEDHVRLNAIWLRSHTAAKLKQIQKKHNFALPEDAVIWLIENANLDDEKDSDRC